MNNARPRNPVHRDTYPGHPRHSKRRIDTGLRDPMDNVGTTAACGLRQGTGDAGQRDDTIRTPMEIVGPRIVAQGIVGTRILMDSASRMDTDQINPMRGVAPRGVISRDVVPRGMVPSSVVSSSADPRTKVHPAVCTPISSTGRSTFIDKQKVGRCHCWKIFS